MQSPRLLLALVTVGSIVSALPAADFAFDSTTSAIDTTTPTQNSIRGSASVDDANVSTQNSITGSTSAGDVTSPSRNSTATGATLGDITSGSAKCVVGDPTEYISKEYVDWVWEKRMSKYVPSFNNFIFDQLVTNKGSLNYCVRWDSTDKLSKADASKFEAMLNRQFKSWNKWLIGYDCWPYEEIDVKIVGWATKDASLFEWSDDSLGTIYTSDKDDDGIPKCPDACYKHQDQSKSSDTSACNGTPFDMSLWPSKNLGGGAGGDWGQRVDADNMMASLDSEELVIVSHEIGHGFGLPDFYETTDKPADDFPTCIMVAGSSGSVTPADGWMLRRVLENIKSRYSF